MNKNAFQTKPFLYLATHLPFKYGYMYLSIQILMFFHFFTVFEYIPANFHIFIKKWNAEYFKLAHQGKEVLANSPVVNNMLVCIIHAKGSLYCSALSHKVYGASCVCRNVTYCHKSEKTPTFRREGEFLGPSGRLTMNKNKMCLKQIALRMPNIFWELRIFVLQFGLWNIGLS